MTVANNLDPDEAPQNVGLHLRSICLTFRLYISKKMGGNNEFVKFFERNKYLKKLPSMQRVNSLHTHQCYKPTLCCSAINHQTSSPQKSFRLQLPWRRVKWILPITFSCVRSYVCCGFCVTCCKHRWHLGITSPLSVCLSVCPSIRPSIRLSVCSSICLSVRHTFCVTLFILQ